jgi:hypothetical protein
MRRPSGLKIACEFEKAVCLAACADGYERRPATFHFSLTADASTSAFLFL